MDQRTLLSLLRPVRRWQRWRDALRAGTWGLLASAAAGGAVGTWRLLTGTSISVAVALAVLMAGPLVAAAWALVWPRSWLPVAATIDQRCRLKDRAVTALQFVAATDTSLLQQLQVVEACERLRRVRPGDVVALRPPRPWPYILLAVVLAAGLLFWPVTQPVEARARGPLPGIVATSEQIQRELQQLEQLAQEHKDVRLARLIEQLQRQAETMTEPGVDVPQALAKISQMQTAIAAERAAYNQALVAAQLKALGEALSQAETLAGVASELQQGRFEEAAEQLETARKTQLNSRRRTAVAERLRKVAQAMQQAGLEQLGGATGQLAEGMESGRAGQARSACRTLARLVRAHGLRARINRLLASKLAMLNECKLACLGLQGVCPVCGGS